MVVITIICEQCHSTEAEETELWDWKALCHHKWLESVMTIVYVVLL